MQIRRALVTLTLVALFIATAAPNVFAGPKARKAASVTTGAASILDDDLVDKFDEIAGDAAGDVKANLEMAEGVAAELKEREEKAKTAEIKAVKKAIAAVHNGYKEKSDLVITPIGVALFACHSYGVTTSTELVTYSCKSGEKRTKPVDPSKFNLGTQVLWWPISSLAVSEELQDGDWSHALFVRFGHVRCLPHKLSKHDWYQPACDGKPDYIAQAWPFTEEESNKLKAEKAKNAKEHCKVHGGCTCDK